MRLINYYLKKKFNPVPIKTNSQREFSKHLRLRKNLIENHLKIPLNLLKDKNIIEFGPNRGENSMIYAFHGAKLHFVEPILDSVNELKRKYKKHNLLKAVKNIKKTNLENYKSKKKFDLVIAEGFLNTLAERNKQLIKLFRLVENSGLIILNYDDFYGSLIELIKSAILKKMCLQNSVELDSVHSLNLSKKLFYNDFKKLKNTRPYKAYWLDQLSCEFAKDVWKFEEILKIAKLNNFSFYSSSPLWQTTYNQKWYKSIDLTDQLNIDSKVIYEWRKNINYFLTGNKKVKIPKNKNLIIKQVDTLVLQLINFLSNKNNVKFKYLIENNNSFLKEINLIIDFLNNKNSKLNYKKLKNFRLSTGTNLHYLCLKKNEKNI